MTFVPFNPLIPGFNPDPSVVKVEDTYYLVTSTFEYLPALPVYRSVDFVRWEQISTVAPLAEQVGIRDVPLGFGVYAPTLRHHDGVFYLIVTVPAGRGCVVFTTRDPAGPWDEGIELADVHGIDPDLAWDDDGTAYVTFSGADVSAPDLGVQQVRVDLSTGHALEEPRSIWAGTGLQFPEAPHLHRRDGYWYLLVAEGGTQQGHSVSVARSMSPSGPFESAPHNPILSARSTSRPIQSTGHADFVEFPDGSSGLVLLGTRQAGFTSAFSPLGRETFATPVEWIGGWPHPQPVTLNARPGATAHAEAFTGDALSHGWMSIRRNPAEFARVVDGTLEITNDGDDLSGMHPCFIARRQTTTNTTVSVELDATKGTGGLAILQDEQHHYEIEVVTRGGSNEVTARANVAGITQTWTSEVEPGPVILTMDVSVAPKALSSGLTPDRIRLSVASRTDPSASVQLADLDGRYLSIQVGMPFTGRMIGLYASEGKPRFRDFRSEGSD